MIDVLKYRWISLCSTAALLLVFAGAYFYRQHERGHAFTYNVELTGGTEVLLKFENMPSLTELKKVLEEGGWERPITREFAATREVSVRVPLFSPNALQFAADMVKHIDTQIPGSHVTVLRSESVGPAIGEELRWQSFWAVLISLIAMLLYIAIRFRSFSYGIGGVIALFHDSIAMLAAFLLFDREISMNVIGAILLVLGYSINDTIVIYAQIRDNVKKLGGKMPFYDIINLSINQTFRRTLLTSFSTLLTVASMFFLGGEALRDFSLALLVGIVFGTYSSIFIASPIMKFFHK